MSAVWFRDLGIHVFPTINKVPAVPKGTSQFDYRCTREQAARFREYGVPLGLFAVADSDSTEAEAWNAAHLPETPFKVTTGPYHNGAPGRGRHRYYQLPSDAPHFMHRDGLTIEFRHRGQYVVGPGSRRPDGVVYAADDWSWTIDDVPLFPVADFCFNDGSCPHAPADAGDGPFALPEVIVEPFRRTTLHQLMRSLAAHGVPLGGALDVCYAVNRERCRPTLDVEATKLRAFLERAWRQKDRDGFVRAPKTGWSLAAALLEIGLTVDVTLAAVRSTDPTFDPETA